MKPSPPAPAPPPKVKTLEQDKTDFTAEGSPPPGVVGTSIPSKVLPALPGADQTASPRKAARARAEIDIPTKAKTRLPR